MEIHNSGSGDKVAKIPLLPGKEADWLTQMEIELRAMDCWDLVNGEDPEPDEPDLEDRNEPAYIQYIRDLREFNFKNRTAFGMFSRSLAMRPDTIRKARELAQFDGNAADAWTYLKESYLVNSASTRLRLRTELHNLRMEHEESFDNYKDRVFVLNSKYQSVNNNVGFGDEEMISTLLYGLDSRYSTIVNMIEQLDVDHLEWNDVVRRVRNFENLNHSSSSSKNNTSKFRRFSDKEESNTQVLMTRAQWENSEKKPSFNNRQSNKQSKNQKPKSNNKGNKWCTFHKTNSHNNGECYYLNKKNNNNDHVNISISNNANEDKYDTCLMVRTSSGNFSANSDINLKSESFYLDSAASKSYVCNLELFDEFSNKVSGQKIEIGDGSVLNVSGVGRIGIFDQIFYSPHLAFNLVSVHDFLKYGFSVEFSGNLCSIFNINKVCILKIFKGSDNLFSININQLREFQSNSGETNFRNINHDTVVNSAPINSSETIDIYDNACVDENSNEISMEMVNLLIADAKDIDISELLHRRLCHVNLNGIISCIRNQCVTGIKVNVNDLNPDYFCTICPLSKSTTKSFPSFSHMESSSMLELIFTDLCGPYGVLSKGGSKYMLTFTDNYSKFVWVYFIHVKSDAYKKLLEFYHDVTALLHTDILCIRSDSGGEFLSPEWLSFCKEKHILLQYSSVYSPQQNGVAERMNRTLNDMGRTILIASGLSPSLWAEALKCAAYVRNRISTAANKDRKSPYQKLFGKPCNISHFRVFGCDAFLHIPLKGKLKLGAKARKGSFIGYDETSPMYKVLMWDSNKVERSRNVIFDEGSFTRGNVRLSNVTTNPYLKVESDNGINPFSNVYDDSSDTIIDTSSVKSSSSAQPTALDPLPESDHVSNTELRKSDRPSIQPKRLSYHKLGMNNFALGDVWDNEKLLTILEHVELVLNQ